MLILSEIWYRNQLPTITKILNAISSRADIPLSTLKCSAQRLRVLGLIEYGSCGNPTSAMLTEAGKSVIMRKR